MHHPTTPPPLSPISPTSSWSPASRQGCQDALQVLITRYRRFARAKARSYFLVGADSDDVEQEALIGLYKAARDFRPEHQSSFRAFAELCITRQIITAIKTATRQKHQALNQYVSISGSRSGDDAGERAVEELIHVHRHGDDPAERIVADERFGAMRDRMAEVLSGLEVDVLTPLRRGQELPGDRRPPRPPREVDRQRAAAHQAQARAAPRRAGRGRPRRRPRPHRVGSSARSIGAVSRTCRRRSADGATHDRCRGCAP